MKYTSIQKSVTEHIVTFENGVIVYFVMKPTDTLENQIHAYLSPPPPLQGEPSETDILMTALKLKAGITEQDIDAAREVLKLDQATHGG